MNYEQNSKLDLWLGAGFPLPGLFISREHRNFPVSPDVYWNPKV